LLSVGASAAPDALFDGARLLGSGVSVPPAGSFRRTPAAFQYPAAPVQAVAPAAPADVAPSSAHGITSGFLGLYPEGDFDLGTGRCSACRAPEQGKWYFQDDVIATPKSGPVGLVWIGSHEMVEGVKLSADGKSATLKDGTVVAFS